MNQTQQDALIYLSKVDYEIIQERSFNLLLGQLDSEGCELLKEYNKALTDASTVFKCELGILRPDEITECLENELSKKESFLANSDKAPAKIVGKLHKRVNSALSKLKDDKPDFILYPAYSRFGLIPKGELSVIEIIDPTDNSEYIDFRPEGAIENSLVKIRNYHSFSKSKFLSWSKGIIEVLQGIVRVFAVVSGYTDIRHVLFFYQHETSYGWKDRSYISKNGILENIEAFGCVAPEYHYLFENLKSANLVTVVNSLTTQEFLDNTLANNVQFALSRFNRAIESHDDCEAIVNLCTSLEAISNQLYPADICKTCSSKKVSEGLKAFLNANAFQQAGLYGKSINPMKEFSTIYSLRSKVAHGSLNKSDAEVLKTYMPKATMFVAITLYNLMLNACTTGFDSHLPLK
ncbi:MULTISPECIES: HEPN domain-containing protein [unclassified Shewanella]|uniref:HEPN domain-containing protein n=1 Tax=unclassified Shewanella TaxID=196818 RepID=UPI001BBC7963|nr:MULTISPECIES: HEPN domain-containing protein [unclassified Shewanella]GIU19966.1 hypothetical protein TUM4444_37010 [Shewanella sp. MBTL60-112-B1]GIU34435.1 hypothetical protein TUM4445_23060 [Shewanella sp. MBTL60-112-B2]